MLSRAEYEYDVPGIYLGWHVDHHLGADEKRGAAKFVELMRKSGRPEDRGFLPRGCAHWCSTSV